MSFDSVGDIGEKIVRDKSLENIRLIKLVYVPQPAQATCDIDFAGDATNGRVLKYIFSFKRGQAASASGWSRLKLKMYLSTLPLVASPAKSISQVAWAG